MQCGFDNVLSLLHSARQIQTQAREQYHYHDQDAYQYPCQYRSQYQYQDLVQHSFRYREESTHRLNTEKQKDVQVDIRTYNMAKRTMGDLMSGNSPFLPASIRKMSNLESPW